MTTLNAVVGGLEVRSEVAWARLHAVDGRVWDDELAGTSTGAACVEDATHVGRTAEMSVAASDAASELHATIARRINQQHLTLPTCRVQQLHVAVFRRHCTHHVASHHLHYAAVLIGRIAGLARPSVRPSVRLLARDAASYKRPLLSDSVSVAVSICVSAASRATSPTSLYVYIPVRMSVCLSQTGS